MCNKDLQECCCRNSNTNCCKEPNDTKGGKKRIVIDFLYLDLNVCTRCQGTERILEDALNDVSKILEMIGVEVILNKVNISSEEKAKEYKFLSSPTIRVNGHDIQMEIREGLCESCGDLCGDNVDCRVWVYNGKEFTEPPKAMIIDAILKEVYTTHQHKAKSQEYSIPDNLKKFFSGIKDKNNSNNCC